MELENSILSEQEEREKSTRLMREFKRDGGDVAIHCMHRLDCFLTALIAALVVGISAQDAVAVFCVRVAWLCC